MLDSDSEVFTTKILMKILGNLNKSQQGSISIISIGIFLILMVFILIMYLIIQGVMADIRSNNSQEEAAQMADNIMGQLTDFIDENELVGYNTKFHCEYGPNGAGLIDGDHDLCAIFSNSVGNNEVTVNVEIKGRLDEEENVPTSQCAGANRFDDFNFNCYTVPFPGSGDASENCDQYNPYANESLPPEEVNGIVNFDNLNHPCNWNKIDEVNSGFLVSLFHSEGPGVANFEVINPVFNNQNFRLILRLRTPCLPGADNNICSQDVNERYLLADNPPDHNYIFDWSFLGGCPEGCEIFYDPAVDIFNEEGLGNTFINDVNANNSRNTIIDTNVTLGSNNVDEEDGNVPIMGVENSLETFPLPEFEFKLVDSDLDFNEYAQIPYIEYQILSNAPISNLQHKIDLKIDFQGSLRNMTLFH